MIKISLLIISILVISSAHVSVFGSSEFPINGFWIDKVVSIQENSTNMLISTEGFMTGNLKGNYASEALIYLSNSSWKGVTYCNCSVNGNFSSLIIFYGKGSSTNQGNVSDIQSKAEIIYPSNISGNLTIMGIFNFTGLYEYGEYSGVLLS